MLRSGRPSAVESNLRAGKRLATRDQSPLEGGIVPFWRSSLTYSKFSFPTTPTTLVSPTQRFPVASPQNKSTSGEVSTFIAGAGRLFRLPRLSHFLRGRKKPKMLVMCIPPTPKLLAIKPRKGALGRLNYFAARQTKNAFMQACNRPKFVKQRLTTLAGLKR